MNETQKEKLRRFNADEIMFATVKEVMIESFLKPRLTDNTEMKAAQRLAIDFLYDALREIKKYAPEDQDQGIRSGQVGL